MTHRQQRPLVGPFVPDAAGPLCLRHRGLDRRIRHLAAWIRAQAESRRRPGGRRASRAPACSPRRRPADRDAAAVIFRQCEDYLQTGDRRRCSPDESQGRDGGEPVAARPDAIAAVSLRRRPAAGALGAWYEMVPRSQGTIPGQHGTFERLHRAAARDRRDGLRRPLSDADPSDRPDQPQGPQQRADRRGRTIPAAPTRSVGARAATTRSIPNSARSRISAASSPPATSTAWRSRSISPCSARPTIPGSSSIREWFSAGRTARSSTPRTRRRSTRTSSTSTSAPARMPARCGTRCATSILFWIDQGVRIFRVDNPHTKPLPFWEWLIREVQRRASRRDLPRRGLHPAEADEGRSPSSASPSPTPTSPGAPSKLGARAIPDRADALSRARVLSPELLRQHARHPAAIICRAASRWMFKSRVALAATLSATYGIYNGFELLEHEPIPGTRGVSRFREVRDQGPGLGQARQHQALHHARSTALGATIRRCSRRATCASSLSRTSNVIGFVKESRRRTQRGRGRDRAVARRPRVLAAARRCRGRHGGTRRHVAAVENLLTGERHPHRMGRHAPADRSGARSRRPAVRCLA